MNDQKEFPFAADLTFFSVMRSSIRRGIIEKIGSSAMCTFLAIRSMVDISRSDTELTTKAIMKLTGFSKPTVLKSVQTLIEAGMLVKETITVDKARYRTVDVIPFVVRDGVDSETAIAELEEGKRKPQGNIRITYTPNLVKQNREDAQNFLASGVAPENRSVSIENFYLTLVVDKATLITGESIQDPELRAAFLSLARAARQKTAMMEGVSVQEVSVSGREQNDEDRQKK